MSWSDKDVVEEIKPSSDTWSDDDIVPEKKVYKDPIPSLFNEKDVLAGLIRGAGSIGATFAAPYDWYQDKVKGAGKMSRNDERRLQMDQALQELLGADPTSGSYGAGKLAAEMAGTAGAGGVLAKGVSKLPGISPTVTTALESFGATTGRVPKGGLQKTADYLTRVGAGAGAGAAGAAAINPDDAETGATFGAAMPGVVQPVVKAVTPLIGRAVDAVTGGLSKVKAGELLRAVGGDKVDDIKAAIAARPDLLPGQAVQQAGVQRNPFQALNTLFEGDDVITATRNAQRDAREATMAKMAGGASSEQANMQVKDFMTKVESEMAPRRQVHLAQLAYGGDEAAKIVDQLSELERTYVKALQAQGQFRTTAEQAASSVTPRQGLQPNTQASMQGERVTPLVPGQGGKPKPFDMQAYQRASNDAEAAGDLAKMVRVEADALRAQLSELPAPFTALPVREAVAQLAETTVNPAAKTVLTRLGRSLKIAGDDPVKIAQVRKLNNELVGDLISSGKLSKGDAAGLLMDVKGVIDKQLGEDMVNKYFKPYADKLAYRDSLEAADALRAMQLYNPSQFIKTIRGDNPAFLDKYSVKAQDLPSLMGPKRTGQLKDVASQMERELASEEAAKLGGRELGEIIKKSAVVQKIPNFLSAPVTMTNTALDLLETRLNAKVMERVKEAARDGAKMTDLLNMFPWNERSAAAKWLTGGGMNRLTPAVVAD